MKKTLLLTISFLIHSLSYGQNELTLPHLQGVLQASYINPSNIPDYKISVGLPGISSLYAGATNTPFSFHELAEKKGDGVYSIREWDEVLSKLKKQNFFYSGVSADLFSLRIKIHQYHWSFNISEKGTTRFSYPKDLALLAIKGNEPFLGNEVNLKRLGLDITHRREYGFGAVRSFKQFILGARIKYIQGLSNISLNPKDLTLVVDPDYYGMKASADASLNTSGFPKKGVEQTFGQYINNTKNFGAGIDLGGSYKLNERITLTASLTNIGFIKWKSHATNYNMKGGGTFNGADLGRPLLDQIRDQDDSFEQEGDKLLDSLKASFQYSETSNKYSTYLVPQIFLSGRYRIVPNTHALASISLEKYKVIRPAFTLGIQQKLGRVFDGLLTYSMQYGRFDNLGIGFVVKPPIVPLQLYFAGDNLINTYTIINNGAVAPLNEKNINFRFGINLVFEYLYQQDKLQYPVAK